MNMTEEQELIISRASHPQIIKARAGSGKTTTICHAATPQDYLFAFNKKIAEELGERGMNAKTWHAWILGELKNLGLRSRIDIFADTIPFYDLLEKDDPDRKAKLREMGRIIPILKENLVETREEMENLLSEFFITYNSASIIWEVYQRGINSLSMGSRKISFSDLLLLGYKKRKAFEPIPMAYVDEAQDTNPIQLAIAQDVFEKATFVGDPAQAIYSFRGAGMGSFAEIEKAYPASQRGTLSISFRCAKGVILEAQRYVPDIFPRSGAPEGIVTTEMNLPNPLPEKCAVLARTNKELVSLLISNLSAGRPVLFKDKNFLKSLLEMKEGIAKRGAPTIEGEIKRERDPSLRRNKEIVFESAESISMDFLQRALRENNPNLPVLSTIHAAKGLEWEKVFLITWEFTAPGGRELNTRELQEEKNLMYVAITRARNELAFIVGEGE